MADIQQLERALVKADAAGDAEAAKAFAGEIRRLRAAAPANTDADQAKNYIETARQERLTKANKEGRADAAAAIAGGAVGIADIGNTVLNAASYLPGKVDPRIAQWSRTRNADFAAITDEYKDSGAFNGARVASNVAATLPVGGVLGRGVTAAAPLALRVGVSPAATANLASALATSGMRAGTATGKAALANRIVGGAVTGGVSAGLVDPRNALSGAVIGGALPPTLMGIGKVGSTIGRSFAIGSGNRALADQAINQFNIPLGVGDIAEGGTIRAVRSMLNDAPFSGGVGMAQREATQKGFNRAVGGTFGSPEEKLNADVVDAAKKRMGAEFDRIWNGNQLQVDGDMVRQLTTMQQQAAKLPKNEGASLAAEINDIFGKMVPDQNGGAVIPGDVANKFQSYLRRRAEGSAGLRNELGDLRQSIISAFNRGIRPEDAAALTANRTQYKAFKTVEPLLNQAEAGVAGRLPGDVPAALLPQAVARQYSQAAGSPLADLSKIGSRFMVDRTKQTGGSMRAALQNTALGTAIVGGGLTNPLLAASAIPAAAGTNALLGSPSLAKYLLSQGQGNRLMQLLGPQAEQLGYRSAPLLIDQ